MHTVRREGRGDRVHRLSLLLLLFRGKECSDGRCRRWQIAGGSPQTCGAGRQPQVPASPKNGARAGKAGRGKACAYPVEHGALLLVLSSLLVVVRKKLGDLQTRGAGSQEVGPGAHAPVDLTVTQKMTNAGEERTKPSTNEVRHTQGYGRTSGLRLFGRANQARATEASFEA